jgi:uncharacterized protein
LPETGRPVSVFANWSAALLQPLSSNGIPIFAISTYDTDYVLVQEEFAATALAALQKAGHELASI